MLTMFHRTVPLLLLMGLACGSPLRAEHIVLKDGSARDGKIARKTATELEVELRSDGITGSITIPMSQVDRIEPDVIKPAAVPTPKPAVASATRPAGAATRPAAPTARASTRPSRGFLGEMAARLVGEGMTSPGQLPPAQRELWETAVKSETETKPAETLRALQGLEAAFRESPDGVQRLESMCRVEREEGFGDWMARVHWEVLKAKTTPGPFDLTDVREVERPALIRIVRENTPPAIEPLKRYFPPINPKTNQPEPFKQTQLQGITVGNAIDIREKASLASALLLAQLKLEPTMPGPDRAVVGTELTTVNRILSRARDLEPAARMAEQKAAREAAKAAAQTQAQSRVNPTPPPAR
jgi:hypothetical protein